MGILELIAKFNPFLAQHINHNANQRQGHTSYLSKTICEELIDLMANRVKEQIISEVKATKYFSVSVDSIPDITHMDQRTCILRYVLPSGPVERYLTFLEMHGHTGKNWQSLLEFLNTHRINVMDCHGQSYDNASNMSGKYNGMQPLFTNNVVSPSMFPAPRICSISLVNLLWVVASLLLVSSASFNDYTLFLLLPRIVGKF